MDGPSQGLREEIAGLLDRLAIADERGAGDEELADAALEMIVSYLDAAALADEALRGERISEEDAPELLAVVDEWAGLASYVVARTYGPSSPMPRKLAGWGAKATRLLRRITSVLLTPLRLAASALGASSWSIAVNFPWGISIGLTWP